MQPYNSGRADKVHVVLDCSNSWISGSNPTRGMKECFLYIYSVTWFIGIHSSESERARGPNPWKVKNVAMSLTLR
jgi:hypothetical protein